MQHIMFIGEKMDIIDRLDNLCKEIDEKGITVEGIALMDKDMNVLFQKRWRQDYPRDIYSNAKSFTSAAVGMAIHDGYLELSDKPYDFFENHVRIAELSNLKKMTLENLLTMSSGYATEKLMYFDGKKGIGADDYVDYLMNEPVVNEPGAKYLYSTGDAVLAAAMVEKAVGGSLLKYMYKNLFTELNMEYPIWETDLSGHYNGGSGLFFKLTDMMKLGVLYLNNGIINGKHYFDDDWVKKSTECKFVISKPDDSWSYGYGYFWRIFPDQTTYRANGVFGQDTIVIPKIDMVIGMQCAEGTNVNDIKLLFDKYLFCDLDIVTRKR